MARNQLNQHNRSQSPMDMMSRLSGSPAPMPQSKRDKKRNMLNDKLQEMVSSFGANLRPHYEAQATAIQVDINLIYRANPYLNKPLEDSPDDIANLIRTTVGNKIPADPVAEQDFLADAGKLYTKFVHEVNDSLEGRDVNLTLLHNTHYSRMAELEQRYNFHVRMAHEEHKLLSNTIRERLIAQLSRKKDRLMKEKDMLDIGDSNALLLHPNQFSLINPASPGSGHKRATRNTGRRGADLDDPAETRRKRQRLFEEPEAQSPAPGPSRIDVGVASPYRAAKDKAIWHQQEAPLYSIDRLFTQKELDMTMNTAAIAATHFLLKPQSNGYTNGNGNGHGNGHGFNGLHAEPEDAPEPSTAATHEADLDDDVALVAPEMDRGANQSHHATRGTTKALAGLASFAAGDVPLGTIMPTFIPAVIGAKANSAPVMAAPLSAAEVDQDLAIMFRDTAGNDPINDKLLERTLGIQPIAEYQYRPPSLVAESQEQLPSLFPHLSHMGGVPMSAQSSQGGHSEAPMMSRSNSARGAAMQRSASGTGLSRRGRW